MNKAETTFFCVFLERRLLWKAKIQKETFSYGRHCRSEVPFEERKRKEIGSFRNRQTKSGCISNDFLFHLILPIVLLWHIPNWFKYRWKWFFLFSTALHSCFNNCRFACCQEGESSTLFFFLATALWLFLRLEGTNFVEHFTLCCSHAKQKTPKADEGVSQQWRCW